MVIVFDAQVALTPVGRPFAPLTPSLDIPVAPVVVWVTVPIELLTQTDGDEEAADAETLPPDETHVPLHALRVPTAFVAHVVVPSVVRSNTNPRLGAMPAYSI
jgi:hypothetical protein